MNVRLKPVVGAAVISVIASASANAALINSYDFNNSFADTLGAGADLTIVGTGDGGTLGAGSYTFGLSDGLQLTNAFSDTSNYAIEMLFTFEDQNSQSTSFGKILDFQDFDADAGFYFQGNPINNYNLRLFSNIEQAGDIPLGSEILVGFERRDGNVNVFLDGAPLFSTVDSGSIAVPGGNIINFFRNENFGSVTEEFSGSVDFIRIHDDASTFGGVSTVPIPAAAPLLIAGLGLLFGLGRRRR